MVDVIIYSLILALVTQWLLPMILNTKNMDWMLSNRDETVDISVMCSRAKRASINFQESYPAFLAISIISMVQGVDIVSLATYWLVLRALFMVAYTAGITYLRTLLWMGSLICLIMMAMALM